MPKYRLTATNDESVMNNSSIDKIKSAAFIKLYDMAPPADLGWAMFKRINKWEGKHLVLRHGGNAVTLETL